jgi:hypothetical protein
MALAGEERHFALVKPISRPRRASTETLFALYRSEGVVLQKIVGERFGCRIWKNIMSGQAAQLFAPED